MAEASAVPTDAASKAPDRATIVLVALILVAGVANLNLAVANVALPEIGQAFDSSARPCSTSSRSATRSAWPRPCSTSVRSAIATAASRMLMFGTALVHPGLPARGLGAVRRRARVRPDPGWRWPPAWPTRRRWRSSPRSGPVRGAPRPSRSGRASAARSRPSARSSPGFLLQHFWWGSVFLVTLPHRRGRRWCWPCCSCPAHVKETTDPVDNLGGILSVVMIGAIVLAINFAAVPDKGTLALGLGIISARRARRVRPPPTPGRPPALRPEDRRSPHLLGGGLCRHRRVRLAHGRHVRRPAVPAERARLLARSSRAPPSSRRPCSWCSSRRSRPSSSRRRGHGSRCSPATSACCSAS